MWRRCDGGGDNYPASRCRQERCHDEPTVRANLGIAAFRPMRGRGSWGNGRSRNEVEPVRCRDEARTVLVRRWGRSGPWRPSHTARTRCLGRSRRPDTQARSVHCAASRRSRTPPERPGSATPGAWTPPGCSKRRPFRLRSRWTQGGARPGRHRHVRCRIDLQVSNAAQPPQELSHRDQTLYLSGNRQRETVALAMTEELMLVGEEILQGDVFAPCQCLAWQESRPDWRGSAVDLQWSSGRSCGSASTSSTRRCPFRWAS